MTEQVTTIRRLSVESAEMIKARTDRQVEALAKSFGLSQFAQMFLTGADILDGDSARPGKPYKQVSLVFTCINKVINAIAGLSLVLSTIDEKIIESGPVYEFLFNNPNFSWNQFVYNSIGNYALLRDVFWIFINDPPKEILIVPGNQMHEITSSGTSDGALIGWEFRGLGSQFANFPISQVHQWRNFNPYDRFHGLGPIKAAEQNLNYTYAAELLNASALSNGAELGVTISVPGKLDHDQIQLLRDQFEARHRGAAKAKRVAVLTGGGKIENAAMTLADLEVAKLVDMSDKKICSAFDVPPGVAGLITEAQYSHGPAMRDFIFNSIIPLATLFAGEITSAILNRFSGSKWRGGGFDGIELKNTKFYNGRKNIPLRTNSFFRNARQKAVSVQNKIFAWFDANQHPVVQEHQQEVAEKVLKFVQSGIPVNQLIIAHDLPYEEFPWGNDWWITMGQVPARFTLEAGLEGITGPQLPEGEPAAGETEPGKTISVNPCESVSEKDESRATSDEQQRLRLWQSWITSWAGIEREYKESLRLFFVRQQRILINKLKQVLSESKSVNDERRTTSDEIIARIVFDLKVEDGKIKVINHTFFEKAGELGIRQVLSEVLGASGSKLNELAQQAKQRIILKRSLIISSQKITGINRVTQNMVARQLRQGLDAGEGLNELSARISNTLGSNRARALSIARTQVAGAVETGRFAGMQESGVELKTWLTSRDKDVRDSHREAENNYASGIALILPFVVGGENLMYPGDPAGSAANIINCRCIMLAKRAAGKSFDLSYYINLQFYSLADMVRDKVIAA